MELQQSLSMFSTSDKVRFLQFLAYCAYVKSEKRNPLATYRIDEKQNWEKKEKKKNQGHSTNTRYYSQPRKHTLIFRHVFRFSQYQEDLISKTT